MTATRDDLRLLQPVPPAASAGSRRAEAPAQGPPRRGDLVLLSVLAAGALVAAAVSWGATDDGRPPDLPVREVRIDVNRASPAVLSALPGVGPLLARRIEDERRRGGPFRGPEDLRRVPGIGPVVVARLAPHLAW